MPGCEAPESEAPQDDTFLFYPRLDSQNRHPFHFSTIHMYQQQDPSLLALAKSEPRLFAQQLGGYPIICHRENTQPNSAWRICIPDALLDRLVQWYHLSTNHQEGMDRLEASIRRNWSHPRLRQAVRNLCTACPICPRVRVNHIAYGSLAPRDAPISPWSEVHVDSIGPWTVTVNNQELKFYALTMIDPVTNLIEIVRYPTTLNAAEAARLFENHWLSRYPRPTRCIHDGGPEFVGHEFDFMLKNAGISNPKISANTPTANSIIEASHKAIGQNIRTTVHSKLPTTPQEADHLVDEALAIAMHAHRCASNSTLGNYSAGALVFQRDMFLDIPLISDILTLTKHRQALIDQRLLRANRKRRRHEFKVNDYVYVRAIRKHKLDLTYIGPFKILQVHTNNTVTILRGQVHERINIRHLKPAPNP